MPTILIIDDEASLVSSLTFALEAEGYQVHGAGTGEAGLIAVAALHPDLILLDLRLPDRSGLEVMAALPQGDDNADAPQVIMISAHGDTRAAVKAVKLGAADYLTKPFDLDELLHTIAAALERRRMATEIDFHRRAALRDSGLVGQSPALLELASTIGRVAKSGTARILVLGESGTGKALVAKAIHTGSPRAAGPFIEINCASLPEQLIEAELFGAEKGAYTGAHARRAGLVALADKGTLFLDEIGELPLPLQAKLLHFLENGQYRAIGSSASRTADVRVVAATNRDLAKEAAAGRFREDLYYRLNVISLAVPPLRERGDDIGELAEHFARRYAHEEGTAPIRLSAAARALLAAHRWPGNVRELKNLIERLTILFPGKEIGAAELPAEIANAAAAAVSAVSAATAAAPPSAPTPRPEATAPPREAASIGDALAEAERDMLLAALRDHAGHKGKAADSLGISRHAFKRRLQRLGIR